MVITPAAGRRIMVMDDSDSTPLAAPLARRVGADADAAQVADAVGAIWHEIDAALGLIMGPLGVVALFNRSVHLTSAAHPWLAAGRIREPHGLFETTSLKSLLVQRCPADALAGGSALLRTFNELLASLIGASLTERLLCPVWAPPLSGPSAPDTTPLGT
jgi:hypothetical protein